MYTVRQNCVILLLLLCKYVSVVVCALVCVQCIIDEKRGEQSKYKLSPSW